MSAGAQFAAFLAGRGGFEVFGLTSLGRFVALPMLAGALLVTPAEAKKSSVGGLYSISIAGFKIGRGTLSLGDAGQCLFGQGQRWHRPGSERCSRPARAARKRPAGWSVPEGGAVQVPDGLARRQSRFLRQSEPGLGNIRSMEVAPQFKPNKERIKITNRHKRNAIDPLSAALMPVGRAKDSLGPKACSRKLPVFDGWTRFDIKLSYQGTKEVSGMAMTVPVVVCKARWVPVAGHRPSKESVKYMARANMEVWIAPMGRDNVLIPYRIAIDTKNGRLLVQASKLTIERRGQRSGVAH